MSSINNGLRRAGIVGLSTLVAASMMTLSAATTNAAVGDYAATAATPVTAPATAVAVGDLTLEFANSWTTNSAQTFTVGTNDCTTAAGIAKAISFSDAPTAVTAAPVAAAGGAGNTADTKPTFVVTQSGSSASCTAAGILDKTTITQLAPSTGTPSDRFIVTIASINYDIAANAPKGNINVATAGAFKTAGTVVNAVIPIGSFTNTARVAALPSATGVTLGTQTFTETTAGAFFATGSTTMVLTPNAGTFTAGVTPTVTVPAGYAKTNPVTTAPGTYTFTVTAPATTVAATVTVTGLTIAAPGTAQTVMLDATVGTKAVDAVPVVNVVSYNARTGGTERYATSVALLPPASAKITDVVLSSGVDFPDALSANYLAGRLGTGTLLTTPKTLPDVVRQAIFNRNFSTVYITGETGAVSQTVQDQIKAMHVSNDPAKAFITVVRLGGANRYATNKLVNEFNFPKVADLKDTVLLATGKGFADALAAGPIASHKLFPLILTQGTTLGDSENTQLNDFNPTNVVIAGGTGVVSQAIEDSLKLQGYKVLRLAGLDRTRTAAQVATWATDGIDDSLGNTGTGINAPQGFDSTTAYITTGSKFADALSAGPVAGAANQVILASNSATSLGAGIPLYLGTKTVGTTAGHTQVGTLHALGQTGAVSAPLMKSAAATIGL